MTADTMKAVRYHEVGGVDGLRFEEVPIRRGGRTRFMKAHEIFGEVRLTP